MERGGFKKRVLFVFILLIIFIFGVFFVFGYGNPAEGFRIYPGKFLQANASSLCIQIDNTGTSQDLFVPSKTYEELNSFYTHLPAGVTADSCSSHPHRIAQWSGKVSKYTDPNTGEWKTDSNCGQGQTGNSTYCSGKFPQTAPSQAYSNYANEWIWNWTDSGCSGNYESGKASVRCRECDTDYGTDSGSCEAAGCRWHSYSWTCNVNYCGYWGQSDCQSEGGCYWSIGNGCYTGPNCDVPTTQNECTGENPANGETCGWDSYTGCCYTGNDVNECYRYSSPAGCDSDSNCQFNYDTWGCHPRCYYM